MQVASSQAYSLVAPGAALAPLLVPNTIEAASGASDTSLGAALLRDVVNAVVPVDAAIDVVKAVGETLIDGVGAAADFVANTPDDHGRSLGSVLQDAVNQYIP